MRLRIITMVIVLFLSISAFAESSNCGAPGNNITWRISNDTLYIEGMGKMMDYAWGRSAWETPPWLKDEYPPWYDHRDSLTNIVIGEGITHIGNNAFAGCGGLISIEIAEANTQYSSIEGVLYNKDKTTLIRSPKGKTGSVTIPASVKNINDNAFGWCINLTNISIPEGVTSIGEGAFSNCHSLTDVSIPERVTSIKDWTFFNCRSLASIAIPEKATSIGEWAFFGCEALANISIPESVTNIGVFAFFGCSGLTSIVLKGTTPPDAENCFSDISKDIPIYVPAGSLDKYKNAKVWKEFTNIQSLLRF